MANNITDAKINLVPNQNNLGLNVNQNLNNQKQKIQRKLYVDLLDGTLVTQPEKFCSNGIRTYRYNLITFLPLAIINQYKNPFNIFFLCMMIIFCIPAISPSGPITIILPVVVVLIINLIREAFEDYKKHKNDRLANDAPCYIYKSKKFIKSQCKEINVGNIVKVKRDENVPADLLIIKSSLKNGFCYMQTANLDGETALKPRETIYYTQKKLKKNSYKSFNTHLNQQNCFIEVDPPNADIYEINGTIFINNQNNYFDSKNVLLRGSRLKSVDYIYGIAIYTGKETKLMKNITRSTEKKSDIDKILVYIIIFLVAVSILLTIISMLIGYAFRLRGLPDYDKNEMEEWYVYYYRKGNSKKNALELVRLFSAHLSLSTVIPISVMVVNTVIKVFQSNFLQHSPKYKEDPGDKIKCYSASLIEQLGKVKYIFSDKTGTLTRNEMIFRGCSIFSQLFDNTISEKGTVRMISKKYMPLPRAIRKDFSLDELSYNNQVSESELNLIEEEKEMNNDNTASFESKIINNFCFDYFFKCLYDKNTKLDNKINQNNESPFTTLSEIMEQLFLNIAINHDVLVEKRTEKKDVIYQGISPDEVTLVSVADELGYTFLSREEGKIIIEVYNYNNDSRELREFQVLKKFDFTSERQCSSIIVKDMKNNKIIIYIKGSDRKIMSTVNSFSKNNIYEQTQEHIDQFAHQGLRTLCFSLKYLEENEFNSWLNEYEDLKFKATKDKSLNTELNNLINKIESNSFLLGATALEDKLQDRVKKDIEDFIEAGINFWMITGDKLATAETIGHSCGIISEDSEVFKIRESKDPNQILEQLEKVKKNIDKSDKELENIIHHHNQKLEKMKTRKTLRLNNKAENKDSFQKINQVKKNNLNTDKSLMPINDNKINNKKELDKKTEDSENSANPSEILAYLKYFEENEDDDYLEKISDIQENEDLFMKGKNILNHNNNNIEQKKTNDSYKLQQNKSFLSKTTIQLNKERVNYMKAYDYFQEKLDEYSQRQRRRCFLFNLKNIYPQPDKIFESNKKITSKFTLIIEGLSIDTCIDNEEVSKLFYELIKESRSLICCRSSPKQKSKIVDFIKKNSDELTLAIGDGGNDVNMIKTADVGIGIFGKEGYQAAYNSDFAISQFKYLKRLLFVDGRFSLARNSYFIYHYFYKNVVYRMSQYWFQIFNHFSGKNLYDDLYATGFNSYFTILPLTVYACIEEDFDADFTNYSPSDKIKLPYLLPDIYKEFRESKPFNVIKFIFIYVLGFFISCIFFLIPAFSFYKGTYGKRGITYSFWDVSWESLFTIIISHFFMIFQDTFLYVKFNFFLDIIQIIINVIILVTINQTKASDSMKDTLWFIMGNLNFWFTLVLIMGMMYIPFFILRNSEYFFGGFIVNLILQRRSENIYLIKYCQKKIEEMTRINRRVAKFMKIYKNKNEEEKVDNFADKQMKEIVDQFKKDRMQRKKVSRMITIKPYIEKIKTKKTMGFKI